MPIAARFESQHAGTRGTSSLRPTPTPDASSVRESRSAKRRRRRRRAAAFAHAPTAACGTTPIDRRQAPETLAVAAVSVAPAAEAAVVGHIGTGSMPAEATALGRALAAHARGRKIPSRIKRHVNTAVRAACHSRCCYCGCVVDGDSMTLDHVMPLANGGKTELSNLVAACVACNRAKDRTPLVTWVSAAPSRATMFLRYATQVAPWARAAVRKTLGQLREGRGARQAAPRAGPSTGPSPAPRTGASSESRLTPVLPVETTRCGPHGPATGPKRTPRPRQATADPAG